AHNFFYAYQQIDASDFAITARVVSITGESQSGNGYRFGMMVISNIDSVANYADLAGWADIGFYNNAGVLTGSRANNKSSDSAQTRSNVSLAVGNYIRIEAYDDGENKRVRRLTSEDGVTFTQANSTTDFKADSST